MGRPRKQPRRILTFNLNEPLADAIDALPIKNRSEWANKVLQEVLDGRAERNELNTQEARDRLMEEAQSDLLANLQLEPRRLAVMLYTALQQNNLMDYKPKGRYTLSELLLAAVNDERQGGLQR